MKNYNIGVIGGSGVYSLRGSEFFGERFTKEIALGENILEQYNIGANKMFFLPRHGKGHAILPQEIDYLTNISCFSELDADLVLSFCTVGSLDVRYAPGFYVVPTGLIDVTQKRKGANYVRENKHVDMTPLFHEGLVTICAAILEQVGIPRMIGGTLVVIEGPRFATSAEQYMYKQLGGDLLNMTQATEIYLSHVFKIPFISLCHVTDFVALVDDSYDIHSQEAIEVFMSNKQKIEHILTQFIHYLEEYHPEIEYHYQKQTFV